MDLLLKCAAAVLAMAGVHVLSRSSNYYAAGLALSFPGLSMLAYYFLYREQGGEKVRVTTEFALFAVIPFFLFLLSLHCSLRKHGIGGSLLISGGVWLCGASLLLTVWNRTHL